MYSITKCNNSDFSRISNAEIFVTKSGHHEKVHLFNEIFPLEPPLVLPFLLFQFSAKSIFQYENHLFDQNDCSTVYNLNMQS